MKNLPLCLTRQELAYLYNIDRRTLYRWCKKAGLVLRRGALSPKELELIFETFGPPLPKDSQKSAG